ncbi:hypothetical protein T484DRAFT_1756622 [Baffinella frigidus]|nr:hypothetical protein T484DRAFT_1756622 [Cryptophyta sp. CCMP2293]
MRLGNLLILQALYPVHNYICATPGIRNRGVHTTAAPLKVNRAIPGWSHLNTTEFLDAKMLSNLRRSMSYSAHSPLSALADPVGSVSRPQSPTSQLGMEGPERAPTPSAVEALTPVCTAIGSVRYRAVDVHEAMCSIIRDVYRRCGGGYTESFYQRAVLRAAYLQGLPVMMERDLFANFGDGVLLAGRVDLEVAGMCLYELKIGSPKILVDSKQIKKYLKTYDAKKEDIQIASLVYFGTGHVFIHTVRERIGTGRSDLMHVDI